MRGPGRAIMLIQGRELPSSAQREPILDRPRSPSYGSAPGRRDEPSGTASRERRIFGRALGDRPDLRLAHALEDDMAEKLSLPGPGNSGPGLRCLGRRRRSRRLRSCPRIRSGPRVRDHRYRGSPYRRRKASATQKPSDSRVGSERPSRTRPTSMRPTVSQVRGRPWRIRDHRGHGPQEDLRKERGRPPALE